MKYLTRWLLPAITVLTVLAAAFLPEKLSQFQDQKLFHAVHSEEMSSNSSLPIWTPNLIQKLSLLDLWSNYPDDSTTISRSLSDSESTPEERRTMEEMVYTELTSLMEAQILSKDLFPKNYRLSSAQRFYIQDSQESSGNWFLSVELYEDIIYDSNYWSAWMILDEETGKMLRLTLYSSKILPSVSLEAIGKAFLDRLGIEYETPKKNGPYVIFPLKETKLQYIILLEPEILYISLNSNSTANNTSSHSIQGTANDVKK